MDLTSITSRYKSLLRLHSDDHLSPEESPETPTRPSHLLWMLERLERGEMGDLKTHRWLGYIQGVMVSEGLLNVQEERDLTRPILSVENKE